MSQFNSQFASIDAAALDHVTGGSLWGKAISLGKKAFDKVKEPLKAAWSANNIWNRATDDK